MFFNIGIYEPERIVAARNGTGPEVPGNHSPQFAPVPQPTIETEFGRFPALQFVTLAELFQGIKPKLPPLISPVKKAARVETRASHKPGAQGGLL